jgi:hypothetical protein
VSGATRSNDGVRRLIDERTGDIATLEQRLAADVAGRAGYGESSSDARSV